MSERVAVVTGGAGRIGGAIVEALQGDGHRVAILDREQVDLADAADVRRAAAEIGQADVLVHAAAALDQAALHDVDLDTWRRVQAVNVEAALLLAQAFSPGMAQRGWGRIVHIVSDTIWSPPSPALGPSGITVNAVAPGLTRTAATLEGVEGEAFEEVRRRQALPRSLVPGDTAATVAFLCSDAGEALTGQTLNVDGGLIFH